MTTLSGSKAACKFCTTTLLSSSIVALGSFFRHFAINSLSLLGLNMRAVQAVDEDGKRKLLFRSDIPAPVPGPSQLLVQVMASPINPSDVMNIQGKFPQTTFPRIPGRDFAGVVISAPPSSPVPENAAVYGTSGPRLSFTEDGAHAEFVVVSVDSVALKPSNLSFAQAAAVGTPFTTAMLALKRAGAKAGDTVLVLGASGAVGSAACAIAKKMGCKVIDVARRDDSTIDLRRDPTMKTVKDLTAGKGVDICVDAVGSMDLVQAELNSLALRGRLAVITVAASKGVTALQLDLMALYRLEHSVVGCNTVQNSAVDMAGYLQEMTPWFESGDLKAPAEASFTKISIEGLKDAYEGMESGQARGQKYMVDFSA